MQSGTFVHTSDGRRNGRGSTASVVPHFGKGRTRCVDLLSDIQAHNVLVITDPDTQKLFGTQDTDWTSSVFGARRRTYAKAHL